MNHRCLHRLWNRLLVASWLVQIGLPNPASAGQTTSSRVVKDLDTPRDFPAVNSLDQWQARAKDIREHVLVCCGLWPMPNKPPLNTHLFGKIEREGYSIERVYFQTYTAFYLAGNLYRPLGHGAGPFP